MRVEVRDRWDAGDREAWPLFHLHKQRCGQQLEAVCRLLTHPLGSELCLEIGGSVQRSEVCRSRDEAFDTSDLWKAAMIEQGWW